MIGAVLFSEKNSEYAIQLWGRIGCRHRWYDSFGNRWTMPSKNQPRRVYMPTHEQTDAYGEVESAGVDRCTGCVGASMGDEAQCGYSKGWAMGRLVLSAVDCLGVSGG